MGSDPICQIHTRKSVIVNGPICHVHFFWRVTFQLLQLLQIVSLPLRYIYIINYLIEFRYGIS